MFCRVLLAGSGAPWKHSNFMPQTSIFEVLRGPRGIKIGPQRLLGPFLERLGLMEASWSALGGLLEPQKVVKRAPREGEPDRGELKERSGRDQGETKEDQAAARAPI